MQPLANADPLLLRALSGLIFDLDDTLLDHGKLTAPAYRALCDLRAAGLTLLVATGRPAGWGEVLARMWPVDAVISENGAIAHMDSSTGVRCLDPRSADRRQLARTRLEQLSARVEQAFPGLVRTNDAHARVSDVTYDIGEHESVAPATIRDVVELAEQLGATTTVSSVHLHLTLDRDDKATGCLRVLREQFGVDTTLARMRFAFIGDSGNDAACFAAFRATIGVANLRGRPTLGPRWLTEQERGAGFAEAARLLIAARA